MKKVGGFVIGALIAACAMGTSAHQQQADASGEHDGNTSPHDAAMTGDAKVFHDAPAKPLDAFVPQDAPLMPDGFCTDNTNCVSTQCCFIAVCVDGTGVGTTLCFPA